MIPSSRPKNDKVRVVLFTGGRGSSVLSEELINACVTAALLLAAIVLAGCNTRPVMPASSVGPHRHVGTTASPNVILIVLDTVRADHVSYAGYSRLTTPFLDRFAQDGVTYRQAHAVAPWTLPSHVSMFTGLLPGQHGAGWGAFNEPADMTLAQILSRSFVIRPPSILLAARLQAAGYSTAAFSSNAWISKRMGLDAGFGRFFEIWKERDRLQNGYGYLPPDVKTSPEADLGDAGLTLMKFKEFAGGGLEEPFFLFFNFIDAHFPYSPPPLWRNQYSSNRALGERIARFGFDELSMVAGQRSVDVASFVPFYDAELSYVDFVLGQLLSWLRERGYYDESLIIVTSDHGELLGEGGKLSHQFSVAEELLRVPLVIRFPGGPANLSVDDPLVSNLDVYETVLQATGAADKRSVGPGFAKNLRSIERLDRTFLIAENDYSLPYLRVHQERFAGFPLDENRVIRRVVYTRDGRFVFVDRASAGSEARPAAAPPAPTDNPEGRARAERILQTYLASLGRGLLHSHDAQPDEQTLDRLRSLGYLK